MLRKTICISLALFFLCCNGWTAMADDTGEPDLTISGSFDYPPYSFIDEYGKNTGMATDITNEMARVLGLQFQLELKAWSEVRADLEKGRSDAIQDMLFSAEREKTQDFSLPYYKASQVIFYRKSKSPVHPNSLSGKKIIVVKGDIGQDFILTSGTVAQIYVADNYPNAMNMLEHGSYDCVLMEKLVGLYWLRQLNYTDITYDKIPLLTMDLCYAAREGDEKTISLINDGLATLKTSGRYKDIEEKWLGYLQGKEVIPATPPKIIPLTDEEKKWLEKHGNVITLAPLTDAPPLDFIDSDGNYLCFTSEYLSLIESRLGIKFDIVASSNYQDRLNKIYRNQVDVITSIQETPARAENLNFTRPYFSLPAVVITRKDSHVQFSPRSVKGLRVAVVRGYSVIDYLRNNYPGIDLIEADNDQTVLEMVAMQEVDAGISDLIVAPYLINKTNIPNLKLAAELDFTYNLCLATRKDLPLLRSILNKGMAMVSEEEKRQIFDEWIGITTARTDWPAIIKSVFIVMIPLLLALLASLAWSYSLRRMVNIKTHELEIRRQEIEQLNSELEKKVEDRTKELSLYTKELEAFSYSVSHDLRAPLRSIDGFSQALLEDAYDALDADSKDYIQRIRAASQKMGVLIDDLLRLSRITRSDIKQEEIDISTMAEEILSEKKENEPERQAKTTVQPGMRLTGDSGMIRILLENLLGNAWKYTARKEMAEIDFGCRMQGEKAVFYIKDNGAGFEMEYADKLFVPFQRLHDQRDYQGIGIGLAIVNRIILRHGGEISAVGKPGEGAVFSFSFPENSRAEVKNHEE